MRRRRSVALCGRAGRDRRLTGKHRHMDTDSTPPTPDTPPTLPPLSLAGAAGVSGVSVVTLRKHLQAGRLPA
jgi:hypothetical protein